MNAKEKGGKIKKRWLQVRENEITGENNEQLVSELWSAFEIEETCFAR